jgi:hypothetical protein
LGSNKMTALTYRSFKTGAILGRPLKGNRICPYGQNFMCSQCVNFTCTLDWVNEKVGSQFFANNPIVAIAWAKY